MDFLQCTCARFLIERYANPKSVRFVLTVHSILEYLANDRIVK